MVGFGIESGGVAEEEKGEKVVQTGQAWSLHSASPCCGVQPALAARAIQPPAQSVDRASLAESEPLFLPPYRPSLLVNSHSRQPCGTPRNHLSPPPSYAARAPPSRTCFALPHRTNLKAFYSPCCICVLFRINQ